VNTTNVLGFERLAYNSEKLPTHRKGETMKPEREKAKELFLEGYNCSQSVFVAYADRYGLDKELALKLSASFGGGMGRMREVCGVVSAMFMVAGMETGQVHPRDPEAKKANYDMVQKLAKRYKEEYGSIICKELLGLVPMPGKEKKNEEKVLQAAEFTDTTPAERTEEYYKKRPCLEQIQRACDILDEVIFSQKQSEDV
jgi:C_GCAxxG_C_C family probable redox protein